MPRTIACASTLKSLPEGLVSQRYVYTNRRELSKSLSLELCVCLKLPTSTHLIEVSGELVGVGFEPGKTEIKVRANSTGDVVTVAATPSEVDAALSLRGSQITALAVVEPQRSRLLRLGAFSSMNQGDRLDYVFRTWSETLHRLAQ